MMPNYENPQNSYNKRSLLHVNVDTQTQASLILFTCNIQADGPGLRAFLSTTAAMHPGIPDTVWRKMPAHWPIPPPLP